MVYDVFGDSSLKVFGSFGIYYDVMKMYMAELDLRRLQACQELLRPPEPRLDPDRRERRSPRRGQPGGGRHLRRLAGLPAAVLRPDRSEPASRRPRGDLLRRREEALGGPVPVACGSSTRTSSGRSRTSARWPSRPIPRPARRGVTENFWIVNPGYGWSLPVSQGGSSSTAAGRPPRRRETTSA
ncbi:MAG: hypothetical protein M0C28_05865 [Candidatus Moduliflexus flocculans]|nr:hypothetical protein [Candidatus Moduliflexus flocculans]